MSRAVKPDNTARQIRGSTLLLAGRGLSVGLNFLTQVVTIRYLVKEDFGALAYALAMASFFGKISRVGMGKAVSRIAAIQDEQEDYAKMFGTLLFASALVVLCGLVITIGVTTLGTSVGASFVTDPLSLQLLLILIALAPVSALDHLMQSVFAIFSKPQLIFFRKHVVGPCLKLAAVLWVVLSAGDARSLAIAHLVTGILGLAIGLSLAGRVLNERNLLAHFQWRRIEVRAREILGYGLPMLGSDAVLLLRGAVVVFLLEFAHGSASVADFRAVLPVARLNNVALESFAFLFIPAVARLTVIRDSQSLNEMYWRSATWVTILTLPIFLVTFCLARPVTVFLFSERYAGAAIVLAVLSIGAFIDATLAMSGHALKAAGRIREVLTVDGVVLALGLALTITLVPRYGALGGAVAVAAASVVHGVAYHVVLVRTMHIRVLPTGFGPIYGTLMIVTAIVLLLDVLLSPPLWMEVPLVAGAWLIVLVRVAPQLQVAGTFPELLRVPLVGRIIRRALSSANHENGHRDTPGEIKATLEHAVGRFATDIGSAPHRVEFLRTHLRSGALIVECNLTGSEGRLPVLVKAVGGDPAVSARAKNAAPDRPRLERKESPETIIDREGVTLRAIHEHLRELDDPRFQSIRVLDVFPRPGIVAMERLPHPSLHRLIQGYAVRPWSQPSARLLAGSANAGAWLRAFHSMPHLGHTTQHHTTRTDFITTLHEMLAFIADSGTDTAFLQRMSDEVISAAEGILPEILPCGLSHGDYAPRNVLVGTDGRVAVIDTPGSSSSTIYLDLGYFLANTWTLMPSVLTGGMLPSNKILEAVEHSFLQGYFRDDSSERDAVHLYRILALLARWATGIQAQRRRSLRSQPALHLFYRARTGHIQGCLSRSLASLERDAAPWARI
jgi:O-antigen/teichoic acid export membrane protein/aminoglycoside phosphotransferase (APT) family kinase protein